MSTGGRGGNCPSTFSSGDLLSDTRLPQTGGHDLTRTDLRTPRDYGRLSLVDQPSRDGELLPSVEPGAGPFGARYDIEEGLAEGGMGVVHLAHDRVLDRKVVIKVLHRRLVDKARFKSLLADEGRVTARLSHPGIAAPLDAGITSGGAPFLVSRYFEGRTLRRAIRDVHVGVGELGVVDLVRLMLPLVEAVAFAHARGVIHRDIKPSNVLLVDGDRAMVLIDFGLARVVDATRAVLRGGTITNISPEQLRGEDDTWDPRTDVYSLGALLFQIVSGSDPWEGEAEAVLALVRSGPPPPQLRDLRPRGLAEIVTQAMAPEPGDRLPSASAFAQLLRSWLERQGAWGEALARVAQAERWNGDIARYREWARRKSRSVENIKRELPALPSDEELVPLFLAEDQRDEALEAAETLEERVEAELRAALALAADNSRARQLLTVRLLARHESAEGAGDHLGAARIAVRMEDLKSDRVTRYLAGEGRLTVRFDADVALSIRPFVEVQRCLVPGEIVEQGRDGFEDLALPIGTYQMQVVADGVSFVYPFTIGRLGHWRNVPPGAKGEAPVHVPAPGDVGPDEVYVPAGPFLFGGCVGAGTPVSERQTVWVDAHVMGRRPVTHGEYAVWLNRLVAEGRVAEAERWAPRAKGRGPGTGVPVYQRDGGLFVVGRDADGDPVDPDWPVYSIEVGGALAWLADRGCARGVPHRLPTEWEWEKATRGVDGRELPWGAAWVAGWAASRDEAVGRRPLPSRVGTHPRDTSVYGVQDCCGNISEMTAGAFEARPEPPGRGVILEVPDSGQVTVRGGSWAGGLSTALLGGYRGSIAIGSTSSFVGFRWCRDIGG